MRLEGKVALISGGARGQGAIEARLFSHGEKSSFTVPSVAQLTQQLLAKGYKTSGPPDAFQDQSGRVRTVLFFDPDGILVQFDEGSGG